MTSRWDELDLLRGLAGVLMLVNHAGYKWLGPAQLADPWITALVFAGSCAPVVFFTASGVGHGLQRGSTRPLDLRGLLRKVGILLVADALLWITPAQPYGLDFLGFIGLTMLVLDPLRRARSGMAWALAGIVVITFLRYGAGPVVSGWPPTPGSRVAQALLGTRTTEGISYPPLPWLAYGLVGFVIGGLAQRGRALVERRFGAVLAGVLALAAVPGAAAWVVASTGRSLHRWGHVSLGFYFVGLCAIGLSVAVVLVVGRHGGALGRRVLELRGTASLSLVPLHYAVLAVMAAALAMDALGRGTWLVAVVVAIAASFAAARLVERGVGRLAASPPRGLPVALWAGVALAFVAKLALLAHDGAPGLVMAMVTVGQVLLCGALVIGPPRPRTRTPPG